MRKYQRRGFFIIFGSRGQNGPDGSRMFQAVCPVCQNPSWFQGFKSQRYFTLFFIPLIPMGPGTRYTRCGSCGFLFQQTSQTLQLQLRAQGRTIAAGTQPSLAVLKRDALASTATKAALPAPVRAAAPAPTRPLDPAGALRFDLQTAPEDSAKLAALLRLYLETNKPDEALAAAKAWPKARDTSDTCLLLCAQAWTKLGDPDRAFLNASAALALNPKNAEAASLVKPQTSSGATDAMTRWTQSIEEPTSPPDTTSRPSA